MSSTIGMACFGCIAHVQWHEHMEIGVDAAKDGVARIPAVPITMISLEMSGPRYRSSHIAIHWITLVLIIVLISLPYATDAYRVVLGSARNVMILHKSLGISVLALTLVRLVLRGAPATGKSAEAAVRPGRGARLGHALLYALLLAMPISGILFNSKPLNLFWLLQIPPLPLGDEVRQWAKAFHGYAQYVFFALILGHAGAALWHHYFRKDGVLSAMSFGGSRP